MPVNPGSDKPSFLRACARQEVDQTPVWLMRQAGRTLPSYRKIREKYSFLEVVAQPELIAEVTLTPFEHLDVDAAIMFADIMLPLASLGVEFDIVESIGPVVESPIRSGDAVSGLASEPVSEVIPQVFEAIKIVRKDLDAGIPLIGFSGAPFTLASYLIEGKPSKDFSHTKALMNDGSGTWERLMVRLSDLVIEYLREQIDAGVQAVQLFDSWAGAVAPQTYRDKLLPYSRRVFDALATQGVPRIHFGTGTAGMLEDFANVDAEVIGVDWRIDLDSAWERIGTDRAIQGNLDPGLLLGPREKVADAAAEVLRRAGGRAGHIFNLGHGVLPDTPLENIQTLVDAVHSFDLAAAK